MNKATAVSALVVGIIVETKSLEIRSDARNMPELSSTEKRPRRNVFPGIIIRPKCTWPNFHPSLPILFQKHALYDNLRNSPIVFGVLGPLCKNVSCSKVIWLTRQTTEEMKENVLYHVSSTTFEQFVIKVMLLFGANS